MTLILKGSHLAEEQNVRGLSHLTGQLAALRRSWLRVLSGRAAAPWKRDLPFSLHGWTRRYVTETPRLAIYRSYRQVLCNSGIREVQSTFNHYQTGVWRDEPLVLMP